MPFFLAILPIFSGVIPNILLVFLKFDKRLPSLEPISITKSSFERL